MNETAVELATGSPDQTRAMAAALAALCRPKDVIGLQGTLGSGKTCVWKMLARRMPRDRYAFVSFSYPPGRLDEVLAEVDAVQAEDIQRIATDLFQTQSLVLAVVGPNEGENLEGRLVL